jgi:hypothetical protein
VRRRAWSSDATAVAVLVGIPLVVFVIPALAGHPAIAGDNVIQNFPLRVLSGDLLRHGHLPLWNPYIWSGSPLLGGLNAGSFYPGTLLFVALPGVAAWVVNLLAAYWAGGLGMYALTRQLGVRPLAALLAAVTFAFGGAMSAQMVHLSIVQGWSWAPLMVLALLRLSWAVLGVGPIDLPARPSSPWPWVTLLAATIGLVLLTGEPRGMAEAEVVGVVVALWLALRRYPGQVVELRRRVMVLGYAAAAGVWGAALGAAQFLPGWMFISASQRDTSNFGYFASGSLHPQWSVLLLVPDLFGGDGILHQPSFFTGYNLTEVTGYVGLVPLVALCGLLTRSFGRRRDPKAADWWMWLALTVLGVLMTFGGYTPVGGLFGHIPFFDRLRLQSRNLGIVDLALAVILAYWLDRVLGYWTARRRIEWRRWVTALPALAALGLCLAFFVIPQRLESALGAPAGTTTLDDLRPWIGAQLVVALGVAALLLGWGRLGASARRRALSAIVVVDLLFFSVSTSTGFVPGNFTVHPSSARAASVLGTQGRFAIYNTSTSELGILTTIGQTDLNAFTQLPSVQGYGSLTYAAYQDPTGTRTLDSLDPCALAKGVFDQLRLATLLTLPQFLSPQLPDGAAPPASGQVCAGVPAPGGNAARSFFFGQLIDVSAVTVVVRSTGDDRAPGPPRVGIIGATGATMWPSETETSDGAGRWSVHFGTGHRAAGLEVLGSPHAVTGATEVTSAAGARYALGGQLQVALSSGWRFSGFWEGYARFARTSLRPPVWLAAAVPGAGVHQVAADQDGTAVIRAHLPRAALVVRSETYQPGWTATAVPAHGGPAKELPVVAHGLIQAVRVPAGTWTLTFSYWAPGLSPGLAASGAGFAVLVAYGVANGVRRRRRPRNPREAAALTD